ncbi:antitoxin Xre/MbcA/ParS toxin-binding domain-containing protein [Dyadobacter arcticus]|uniref:Toxin-antitoxin system antitoxin component (TIGR02293 family) n=1 Tax=Dyadobacter arcticus TaxID=1078754 RepID=A0ABX0UNL3_9BACT|nr:antitoxin Xre/MbcA/ParS toxin-binding domain-containing protein [Dyadobacter arcticus]NIJ54043.1 putative toxin-antitoxin system antitoxin component (TIGR02293 family) [Dyadobacter arcticus]
MSARMVNERLGGYGILKHTVKNDFDLAYLAQNGIPKASIQHLADSLGMDIKDVISLLPVTSRNLQRYNDVDLLSNVVSDHLIALADLFSIGVRVLGKPYFLDWLNNIIPALGQEKPVNFLTTHAGIELIKTELGRIEHGIFA